MRRSYVISFALVVVLAIIIFFNNKSINSNNDATIPQNVITKNQPGRQKKLNHKNDVLDALNSINRLNGNLKSQEDADEFTNAMAILAEHDPELLIQTFLKGVPDMFPIEEIWKIMIQNGATEANVEAINKNLSQLLKADNMQLAYTLSSAVGCSGDIESYSSILGDLFQSERGLTNSSYFFNSLITTQGESAMTYIDQLCKSQFSKDNAKLSALTALSKSDPLKTLQLTRDSNITDAGGLYGNIFAELTKKNPALAKEEYAKLDHPQLLSALRHPEFMALFTLGQNSEMLKHSLEKLVFSKSTSDIYNKLVTSLHVSDPIASYQIISKMGNAASRDSALDELSKSVNFDNASAYVDFLGGVPSELRERLTFNIAGKLSEKSYEEAMNFLNSTEYINDPSCVGLIIEKNIPRDRERMEEAIDQNLLSGRIKHDQAGKLYADIALIRANENVTDAISWARSLDPKISNSAFGSIVKTWAQRDPQSAANWLASEPPSNSRNSGIRALIDEIDDTDPAGAEQWKQMLQK